MVRWPRLSMVLTGLILLGGVAFSPQAWAEEPDHIGIVLAVDGTAEVRLPSKTVWETLQFRDHVFLDETIRTQSNGKVKLLLRNDSIMTLSENSEMHISEFLLNDQQHRSLINLVVGKVRVLTTKLFGRSDAMEIRTPNAVAGVRSSEKHVEYDDKANHTTVLCVSGHCYLRHHDDPKQHLRIPVGHVTKHTGFQFPSVTRQLAHQERQLSAERFALTTHDPRVLATAPESSKALQGPPRRHPQQRVRDDGPPPLRGAGGDGAGGNGARDDAPGPRAQARGDGPLGRNAPPAGEKLPIREELPPLPRPPLPPPRRPRRPPPPSPLGLGIQDDIITPDTSPARPTSLIRLLIRIPPAPGNP